MPASDGLEDGVQPSNPSQLPRNRHHRQVGCITLRATKLMCCTRGSGEDAGHRSATVRHRLSYRLTGPHRPTAVQFFAERHLLRVLRRFGFPEYQDLSRGALRFACRLFLSPYFLIVHVCSLEDLICHGRLALRETLEQDKEPTTNNIAICIVGPGGVYAGASTNIEFRILEGSPIKVYLHTMWPNIVLAPSASTSTSTASTSASAPEAPGDGDVGRTLAPAVIMGVA